VTELQLRPLPLQRALVEHLQSAEPELWEWFSSAEAGAQQEDEVRRELLKSTYRLEREAHASVYAAADRAQELLGIDARVTFYQAQGELPLNAMLLALGGEAHVVFAGTVQSLLDERELEAVIAHELAHFALWQLDGGAYFTAERMLTAFVNDPRAHHAHVESDRRFTLAMEVFADRGGALVAGDLAVAVASLVKLTTGLATVDAASYLRQADEIFAGGEVVSGEVTHPEPFIRARALRLWTEQGDAGDAEVEAMIIGPLDLDALDLVGQSRLTALTRRLLASVLAPSWLRTDQTLAHAHLFFPDLRPEAAGVDETAADWRAALERARPSVADYACYVLLDLAVADPDVADAALAETLAWSDRLGIAEPYDGVVLRELGLTKGELAKRRAEAAAT
jgi:hypothetical protein